MKVTIATLYKDKVCAEYTTSLTKLAKFHNFPFALDINEGALVSTGRNKQFFTAKKDGSDYILYIDSDIVFPEDALAKLMALNKPVSTGIYYQRLYPFRPVIYDITETDQIRNIPRWEDDKPFKIDACGAGFLLIRKDVFDYFKENVDEPFSMFRNKVGTMAGEDTSFCIRCKNKGIEIWADPSIVLGHIRSDIVTKDHWKLARQFLECNQTYTDKNLTGIDGWMSDKELEWLSCKAKDFGSILEVGSWKGRSTTAMLKECPGIVYAVDNFKGSDEEIHREIRAREGSIFAAFANNVDEFENLIVLKLNSKKAASLFPDKSIDMIFIDASHGYEDVKSDIELWMPKAKHLICGHDYCDGWPDIKKAVDDTITNFFTYDTIWYKEL